MSRGRVSYTCPIFTGGEKVRYSKWRVAIRSFYANSVRPSSGNGPHEPQFGRGGPRAVIT